MVLHGLSASSLLRANVSEIFASRFISGATNNYDSGIGHYDEAHEIWCALCRHKLPWSLSRVFVRRIRDYDIYLLTSHQHRTYAFWICPLCSDHDKILPRCAGRMGSRNYYCPLPEGWHMGIRLTFWYVFAFAFALVLLDDMISLSMWQPSSRWTRSAQHYYLALHPLLRIRKFYYIF